MQMNVAVVTYKQAAFAKAVALGAPLAEAYREAYAVVKMSGNAVRVEASRLAKNPDVALMVRDFHSEASARHRVTTDTLIAEADDAFQIALSKQDAASMVGATRLKAMLTGLLVRARDTENPLAGVTDEQVRVELCRLRADRLR